MCKILDKRYWNIDVEISIRRMVGWKDREKQQRTGTYLHKYEEEEERKAKENYEDV
jgi:hypothetical protein